jgi:hypothetical protein
MQPATQSGEQSFLDRFIGVMKLDAFTWNSIKRDAAATRQAWVVVLLAGLISGIGSAQQLADLVVIWQSQLNELAQTDPELAAQMEQIDPTQFNTAGSRVSIILFTIIGTIISWYLFTALARWAARQFFGADPNAATTAELRRLTGWAHAPGLLTVLAPIPGIGLLVSIAVAIWAIVTMVSAVKNGMNLSTGKSIGATIVAAILPGLALVLLICVCVGIAGALGGVTTATAP